MTPLEPLGDRAFLARFPDEPTAARWAEAVRGQAIAGLTDVVAAYRTAAVFADPGQVDLSTLETRLRAIAPPAGEQAPGRLVRLPVLYDGPDLDEAAGRLGLSAGQLIARHAGRDYRVFAIGFMPGFPYAGYLPEALAGLPRRETPRARVPAGSVAIAGRQTGVYPGESPGGWHLLGRTPLQIVDVEHGIFPIQAGDLLRFDPIDQNRFDALRGHPLWTVAQST
jgi:KipI family sensor histidine kinase inhibitor